MDSRHPPAEVRVDADLVRGLLESQHPRFLSGEVALVDEGWDNFTYRVGSDYVVRLPRREAAVQLLLNEQRWLPLISSWIPLAVPVAIGIGVPSPRFRWPWSVVKWIPGTTAEGLVLSSDDARVLAESLRSLHRTPPPDAPPNPFRGVPLAARRAVVEERFARSRLTGLDALWRAALEAPPAETAVWLHGDLHPRNVLVRDGALGGLIDWGDMTAGDPATDLACAWMLFDAQGRAMFLEAYDPTEDEHARAMGWAVNFGSAMLDSGHARHAAIGRAIVQQLVDAAEHSYRYRIPPQNL